MPQRIAGCGENPTDWNIRGIVTVVVCESQGAHRSVSHLPLGKASSSPSATCFCTADPPNPGFRNGHVLDNQQDQEAY